MNTTTGEIVEYKNISVDDRHNFVNIKRPLTIKEKAERQIHLYSLCGCGSGKKFKFCCKK